jgi:hypothetical protein
MKVIAKVDSGRVLCEVSVDEIAQLNGFRSQYDSGFSKSLCDVGVECNLNKMVTTSQYVRTMDTKVIEHISKSLQDAMDKVSEAGDFVNKLNLFDKLKNNQL